MSMMRVETNNGVVPIQSEAHSAFLADLVSAGGMSAALLTGNKTPETVQAAPDMDSQRVRDLVEVISGMSISNV